VTQAQNRWVTQPADAPSGGGGHELPPISSLEVVCKSDPDLMRAREGLRRSEVTTHTYLWFDVADASSETAIRLIFPLPNRAEGRQVAAALPVHA
jgi:hypothetical protein